MANNFIWYYLPDKATQIDALKKESKNISLMDLHRHSIK